MAREQTTRGAAPPSSAASTATTSAPPREVRLTSWVIDDAGTYLAPGTRVHDAEAQRHGWPVQSE